MSTPVDLQAGLRLSIQISVPMEVSGRPFSEIEMTGRVVSKSKLSPGSFGYQVEFDTQSVNNPAAPGTLGPPRP